MNHAAAPDFPQAQLYGHGGRLGAAARHFPNAPEPWIDLSTGISPWPYPFPADLRLSADWPRLPEPETLARLEAAAAAAFGAPDPDEVVAVPGSDLAIRLLPQLMGQTHAHYLAPIYSGYRAAWPDARPVTHDRMEEADLLILANPNNPDGRTIAPEALRALPGQLIVDEAFADASPEVSLAPNRWGAIVLRSFGKFFGLAGLRLGFVLADRPLASRLRALLGDWPVSAPAIGIATAAYEDRNWQTAQRARLNDASGRLDTILRSAGLEIAGGTPLFRLARTEGAPGLFRHLAQAGILVRPFAEDSTALRFGLPGDEPHWQRLEQALSTWSKQ
jgi:cobalamin biosynthetic protein CobC